MFRLYNKAEILSYFLETNSVALHFQLSLNFTIIFFCSKPLLTDEEPLLPCQEVPYTHPTEIPPWGDSTIVMPNEDACNVAK